MHFSVSLRVTEKLQSNKLSLIMKAMAAVEQMRLKLMQEEISKLISRFEIQAKFNM